MEKANSVETINTFCIYLEGSLRVSISRFMFLLCYVSVYFAALHHGSDCSEETKSSNIVPRAASIDYLVIDSIVVCACIKPCI